MRLRVLVTIATSTLLVPLAVVIAPGAALASGCNSNAIGSWSNNCTVTYGSVNNLVIGVQEFANGIGCGAIADDGSFGKETLAAVKCMQNDLGVKADGSVGPITWGAMQSDLKKGSTSGGWQYWGNYPVFKDFRENTSTKAWDTWDADSDGWVSM